MKQKILDIMAKLDAMTLRERIMIFLAVAVVLVALINTVVWSPMQARYKLATRELSNADAEVFGAQAEMQKKLADYKHDPDEDNLKRLNHLKEQQNRMFADLRDQQKGLVAPDDMAKMLEQVLRQHPGLRLISLNTLENNSLRSTAPELADTTGGKAESKPDAAAKLESDKNKDASKNPIEGDGPIFRHGVTMVVEGSYPDLLAYVTELEGLRWQLYWGDMQLDVQTYPKAQLTFELYTLSLDRKWMNL